MKRWLLRLHRWSGLSIAAFVLVIGATGAVTTYQGEIDAWLNRDLLRIEPPATLPAANTAATDGAASLDRPSLDALASAAEREWPGMRASSVRMPQAADESVEFSVAPSAAAGFAGHYVYVDPNDGEVLGSRPFDPDPWSRRGVVASLYEVHYSLAASRAGVGFVSLVAAVWLAMTGIGLVLAWPRTALQWQRLIRVRTRGGIAPFTFDLHRLTGMLIAPVLMLVLGTGIALNLAPQATALVRQFSLLTFEPALPVRNQRSTAPVIGWQAALDAARVAARGARPHSMYLDLQRQVYVARLREAHAIHRRGQTRAYIDAHDGTVLAVWNPRAGSPGDRLWAWQNPLHSGHAFGAPGRLLVFCGGLAALVFVLTGVPLWLTRRVARRR